MEKFGIQSGNSPSGKAPPAWAGLASALLLGIRDNLDSDLAQVFSAAGCTHVLALSGMHLAILSGVITFLLRLCMGIRPASLLGAVLIVIYIFLAGAQPSLVRAGIIYLLGVLALWGFLKKDPLSLLALSFILQIFIQRESGTSLSFILSYLALLGILITGKTIHELLQAYVPEILNQSLSASLGAIIATMAITAYYFGVIRPIGIIAGLFIMPLSSLFMILALISLVLVSFVPILFDPLSFILNLVYRLMEIIVSVAGKVPGLKTPNFIPVLLVSLAIVILLECLKYWNRKYRRRVTSFEI
jgi:competence protein ComEC